MDKHSLHKNKRTGLLEHEEHDYILQNESEPELFRGVFDYDEVPKVVFNDRRVPRNPAEEWWITDTTFRDGQQSTAPLSVKQIVDIFKLQSRLGGPKGLDPRQRVLSLQRQGQGSRARLSGAGIEISGNNQLDKSGPSGILSWSRSWT